jgi:hypothetical protein
MKDQKVNQFSFKNPSIYKIKVFGDLNQRFSERIGGMQLNVERFHKEGPVSVLIGQINDQSALSGVLNTLYDRQLTIISVAMLKEPNE